jgi:hypothetical protein
MISDIGREVIVTGLIDCISSMQMSVWLMPEARFTFVFTYRKGKKGKKMYTQILVFVDIQSLL